MMDSNRADRVLLLREHPTATPASCQSSDVVNGSSLDQLPVRMAAAIRRWVRDRPNDQVMVVATGNSLDDASWPIAAAAAERRMSRPRSEALLALPSPCECIRASPEGIRRLLRWLLNHPQVKAGGFADGTCGLGDAASKSALSRTLYRQRFIQHPDAPGAIYGFFEAQKGGRRLLFHTGGRESRCLLLLIPDEESGFCIITRASSEAATRRLERELLTEMGI